MDCNVCGQKIPLLSKLFLNQYIGLECRKCLSVLAYHKKHFILEIFVLFGFFWAFVKAIEGGSFWWFVTISLFIFLTWCQLTLPLKVVYEGKQRPKKI